MENQEYRLVKTETLLKLADVFIDLDEMLQFIDNFTKLSFEVIQYRKKLSEICDERGSLTREEIAILVFQIADCCQGNIEIIRELIKLTDYKVVSKEELNKYQEYLD